MVIRPETTATQFPADERKVICMPVSGCTIAVVFRLKSPTCVQETRAWTGPLCLGAQIKLTRGIKQTPNPIHPLEQDGEIFRMAKSPLPLKDKALVKLTLEGQTECFSVLMDRHAAGVRNYLSALVRNQSDLDDVVQDTFMKAWIRLSTFRFQATFRTWLISVALNEALTLYRRRKYRLSYPVIANLEAFPSKCESPYQAFASMEARFKLQAAIQKLPSKYREVLILCDLEQLTMRETAKRMNASIPLVKTRLFRARHMLSATMNERAA